MPMREQSRIKADTVAEECTCEECTAPAPDIYDGPVTAGMRFEYKGHVFVPDGRRGAMGEFLDANGNGVSEPNLRGMYRPIPAPAPEPSAPPTGVPLWATVQSGTRALIDDIANDVARLPLDTGTATDTSGEAQADAIKAAVDKANNRAADAFHAYHFHDPSFDAIDAADFEAWLRSGEDAPGAVGK